ncbi:MAG: methylmalonyl Co-A mutase-associated GTPase MeaB [Actinomycetota bacterium]|nr:methylmalonyl Co-A mutase-associated GTPase MeaB [Actinomycetota bacterium]
MLGRDPAQLAQAALGGDQRALARLISIVEDHQEGAPEVLATLYPHAGRAYVVGITGAPGSGKSTITDQLIRHVRQLGEEVGVLAVDPSSPFSGGAILGDRVRMQDHVSDPGVYVRSLASRGQLGGVSEATPKAVMLLDAVGKPHIFVETVGVGQAEVEIVESADTTMVVVNPGWGDSIQANKAGLLEIADIFAVNKADRPGVGDTVRDLKQMLQLGEQGEWMPPIVQVVATDGKGIPELWEAVEGHRRHLERSGELGRKREERTRRELQSALVASLLRRAEETAGGDRLARLLEEVRERRLDPWTAAEELLGEN